MLSRFREPDRTTEQLRSLALLVGLSAVLLLSACSGETRPADLGTPTGASSILGGGYPRFSDEQTGFSVILGTPDVGIGTHRVAFVLSDAGGLVRRPVLRVASYGPDSSEASQEVTARFYEFPLGIRGIYVTQLAFDRGGEWALEVKVPSPTGEVESTRFPIDVPERTAAPAVGDIAPASASRTVDDVDSLQDLSTGAEVDSGLYAISIRDAVVNGLPTMIVFASPGFCTNALCGPQAEVLSELRTKYPDAANYIHVDLFENPVELQSGGLERAIRSPLLEEWGLETDEWTFVLDAEGRVTHRFEAFVPIEELEPALASVIAN